MKTRFWLTPALILALDAVLLFGAVTTGLQVPVLRLASVMPGSPLLDYSRLLGGVSPLRSGFVAEVLGFALPSGQRASASPGLEGGASEVPGPSGIGASDKAAAKEPEREAGTDEFENATTIHRIPYEGTTDGTSASREANEPSGCSPVGGTVWYHFQPEEQMRLLAGTPGSRGAAALGVFQGTALPNLQRVGCDVDLAGHASVAFVAIAGKTYYFQVSAPAGGRLGFGLDLWATIELASVSSTAHRVCPEGGGGEPFVTNCSTWGSIFPSISADGRYVAFTSDKDLGGEKSTERCTYVQSGSPLPDQTWCRQVWVRDLASRRTDMVSVSTQGEPGNGESIAGIPPSSMSQNGRYVAFMSWASNLVPGDTNRCPVGVVDAIAPSDGATNNCADIFVHDRLAGRTERISVSSTGEQANERSYDPAISPDGRYVAFVSFASNLVAGDTNRCAARPAEISHLNGRPDPPGVASCADVFVHDRVKGTTERVSVTSDGAEANGPAETGFAINRLAISEGGRLVAFVSDATNLVPGDTNETLDVFVHDRRKGKTERVSVSPGRDELMGASFFPGLSRNGRYITFTFRPPSAESTKSNDCVNHFAPTAGCDEIFRYDRSTRTTRRVTVPVSGETPNGASIFSSPSSDGRLVLFASTSSNLVRGDTNHRQCGGTTDFVAVTCSGGDVFVRDMRAGVTTRISLTPEGEEANASSFAAALSSDARFIAFESWATNLADSDLDALPDIFVYDRGAPWVQRGRR